MTRSRRFFGGLSLGYLYQGLVIVAGIWLTPFLLKHLGQHDYGLWLVGLQTLSYLVLMDFGIVALLPRETAYVTGHAIGSPGDADLAGLIGRTARVVLYQTPLVALAVSIVWITFPIGHAIRGPLLIALAGFVVLFPLRIFQAVLHGLQEMTYIGKLQFISWTTSTGLMVILVLRGMGLYSLAIGWVAGQLIPAGLCFYKLKAAFPEVLPSRLPKLGRKELITALLSGGWVSLAQVAQVLIAGTDYVVIGKLLGASAVVPYACTQKLIYVFFNQPHMIMEMAAPGISQMKTSESRDRIFRACNALTLGMLATSGALGCVALAVNHSLVSWWVGDRLFGGEPLTMALVAYMILRHWNSTAVYTIFALGYERRISITSLIDGVVNVAASVLLVWKVGPIGAVLGSIIGVSLISLPGNLSALASELRISMLRLVSSIWSWFWRFLIVAAGAFVLGLRWRPNFPYVAGMATITGVLYALVMLPLIMNSDLKHYVHPTAARFLESLLDRFRWSGRRSSAQQVVVCVDSAATELDPDQELELPKNS